VCLCYDSVDCALQGVSCIGCDTFFPTIDQFVIYSKGSGWSAASCFRCENQHVSGRTQQYIMCHRQYIHSNSSDRSLSSSLLLLLLLLLAVTVVIVVTVVAL
jgi:hypothetical protein